MAAKFQVTRDNPPEGNPPLHGPKGLPYMAFILFAQEAQLYGAINRCGVRDVRVFWFSE